MPMHSRKTERKLNVFEKYLTVWVILCIIAGIGVGRAVPGVARYLYGIALFFLGFLFKDFIGAHAYDFVKLPLGADWDIGSRHGAGIVVLHHSGKMLLVPLWRSYLAGCILLGIAPCTAMVLVWGYLARGNDGHTLVMVAINSLSMLVLYGPLGGFLLGVGRIPVPWEALVLSIAMYVALTLVAGYFSRT